MACIVEKMDGTVLPIGGQGVLCQIVCTDAEKVGFSGKFVAEQSGRRSFDHGAQRDLGIKGGPVRGQIAADQGGRLADFLHFPDGSDHGHHDGDRAEGRRAIQRTQLGAQQIAACQTQPDGPQAHSRIFLLRKIEIGCLLIRADIQCAESDGLALHGQNGRAVQTEQLLLTGTGGSAQILKFRAEQARAFRIIFHRRFTVLHSSHIGKKMHGNAIFGHRWLSFILQELLAAFIEVHSLFVNHLADGIGGFNPQCSRIAVNGSVLVLYRGDGRAAGGCAAGRERVVRHSSCPSRRDLPARCR